MWAGGIILYLALGVVHGLLVTGLAARARHGWPVWTTETGRGWVVNLLLWPGIAAQALGWGIEATWQAWCRRERG